MVDQHAQEPREPATQTGNRVGVVTIGRNEGERLIRCLKSLAPLGLPIVYVDSASTDGSLEAAHELGADVLELDLGRPFTAARARNEGFEQLLRLSPELEYVQFVDGDCEVDSGWIRTAAEFLDQHDKIAAVFGRRRERYPSASLYNRLCDEEWDGPVGEAESCGGDVLMKVAAFSQAGGYTAGQIAHEEPELCGRIRDRGWQIWRIGHEMTLHDAAIFRFSQWWNRNKRAGFGYAQAAWSTRGATIRTGHTLVLRSIFWAGFLPLLFLVATVFWHPAILGVPLVYTAQLIRLYFKERSMTVFSLKKAALHIISKFAELWGILNFAAKAIFKRRMDAIIYK